MTTSIPPSSLTLGTPPASFPSIEDASKLTFKDEQKLVQFVRQQYDSCKSARTQTQMQWYLNMSFYYGRQWVEYLPKLGKLATPPAPPYRVRHTSNRIRPLIRTEFARITSQKPNATVVPASSDDDDLMAAQAGEQVWESIYHRKKVHQVFKRSALWTLLTGVGFIKTYWDNTAIDVDSGIQGDICYDAVTPFHLFVPDLREIELESQPYLLNAYTRPVEWVRHFWGTKVDPKNFNPSVVAANEILEDVYLNLQGGTSTSQPDSCLVIEAWMKPGAHSMFKEGGLVTIVDNQVVQFSPNGLPYLHGEYPFTKFEHIPTGKFYADSTIVDVIPLQREFNRTRSQIIESKNRMAKPQLMAPQGSVDVGKITTEPGQVILYRPGYNPPQPLPLQSLPPYVLNELQQTLVDIEDISGQHQVSKGNTPPGVTAATAISYLQEKDDSYLSHTYDSIEAGFEKIARQSLNLAVQYWDSQRLVKTTGTDQSFDALMLSGADLKNGTDIRIESGSALPTSKAAKQAFLMDLFKMGAIDQNDMLSMLDMGGVQKLYEKIRVDERQAQRENLRMRKLTDEMVQEHAFANQPPLPETQVDPETGMPVNVEVEIPPVVSVNTWDNHVVHIEIHNRFRKSQAFEALSPVIKEQFEKHVNLHVLALAESMGPGPGPGETMPEEMMNENQFSGMEGMNDNGQL